MQKGYFVGSHLCHYLSYGDPSDTVAGSDCSGFLSWIWNVSRQSTAGFYNNSDYRKINRDSPIAGDALVKPNSHIVLVAAIDTTTDSILIIEETSAVNGIRRRYIDRNATYWMQYTPIRNGEISSNIAIKTEMFSPFQIHICIKNGKIRRVPEGYAVSIYTALGKRVCVYSADTKNFKIPMNIAKSILFIRLEKKGSVIRNIRIYTGS
jgi:phage anti-repressor protein